MLCVRRSGDDKARVGWDTRRAWSEALARRRRWRLPSAHCGFPWLGHWALRATHLGVGRKRSAHGWVPKIRGHFARLFKNSGVGPSRFSISRAVGAAHPPLPVINPNLLSSTTEPTAPDSRRFRCGRSLVSSWAAILVGGEREGHGIWALVVSTQEAASLGRWRTRCKWQARFKLGHYPSRFGAQASSPPL